ncbi:MAG: hypothetical protein Q8Q85_04665 [Gemmatimonadales bacterium]|nr:hypothetical protein [Gemmatimonadales bacterium]
MIATTVRATLGAEDERLALLLLADGSETERRRLEARAASEGSDVLWDDPRLVRALLSHRGLTAPSAALFLYAMLRRLLLEAGVDDRLVTDYCASLVLAFGRKDRAYRIGEHDENRYAYLVDLVAEADRTEGERQFRVRAHLGNFALWLTGIFPDYIAARRARKGGPDLPYYEAVGKSGFRLASDHALAGRYGLDGVLRQTGERFHQIRIALNRFSDRMMFPNHDSPDRLMRQVADEFGH